MIQIPVDIVGEFWGDMELPSEGNVSLTKEQFAELYKEAILCASIWWEPDSGLRGLLECSHEYNEKLIALVEFCAAHIRTRHYLRQCPFCEGTSFRYLETPTETFQVVCPCGARGPLKPSMEEALKAFSV